MPQQNPFTHREMAVYNEVAALTRQVARPLIWHDPREPYPKCLLGGTCFILRFQTRLVGITATHVIKALEDAKEEITNIECLLRTVPFDILSAIIAQDGELDIVTFEVTEDQLIGSEAQAIDCTREWPPPIPEKCSVLSCAGCPEVLQTEFSHSKKEFHFYVGIGFVDAFDERNIFQRHDPEGDIRLIASPKLPDRGANFSGCSGGPVLMHTERNGLHRWSPVALIVQQGQWSFETAEPGWERFQFRRIHFVKDDGSIENPKYKNGWLPG